MIKRDSSLGILLTFLSVAILIVAALGGIALMFYAAFVEQSAMAMGVVLMIVIGLPIMWLGWEK